MNLNANTTINANISLKSFSDQLGTVNDGDFILQQNGGATSLERVNRGQNAISKAFYKYKQMNLSGAGEANYRTRVTFMHALISEMQSQGGAPLPARYIEHVCEQLGLVKKNEEGKMVGTDPLESKPLSARMVKDLIDSAKADVAKARQQEAGPAQHHGANDGRELNSDGYSVVHTGFSELGDDDKSGDIHENLHAKVMMASGKDKIQKPDDDPEEKELDLSQDNVEKKIGDLDEDQFVQEGTARQEKIDENPVKVDNERIKAKTEAKVKELESEIKRLREEVRAGFIARFSADIETLKTQLESGRLVIFSSDANEPNQEIPVDGITKTILLESLKKDGVSYFSDAVDGWLDYEDKAEKFTSFSGHDYGGLSQEIDLEGSQSGESIDGVEVADLKRELEFLRAYRKESGDDGQKKVSYEPPSDDGAQEVLGNIGKRLETLKLAIDTALKSSETALKSSATSVLGSNGFAKVVNEVFYDNKVEKPCSDDFTANISWIFRNHERTGRVSAGIAFVRAGFVAAFPPEKAAALEIEDPTLVQDLLKAYDEAAQDILKGVNVPVPRKNNPRITDYQDLQSLLNQVNGLPKSVRKTFAKRIEKAEARSAARKEVLEQARINQRIGEMLTRYENRISKEKFEKIRNFRDKPNEEIKKLIDDAVTSQVERKNIGSSNLVTVFKTKLEAFVRELVRDDVAAGQKQLEENRARFVALTDQYMDPNNQTYGFRGLAEKSAILTPDGLGRIKEAAIQYAFEQVKTLHKLPADLNGGNRDKVWAELEGKFREAFKIAMIRAFNLVEHFQGLLTDKKKPLDPIMMDAFKARLYLNKAEKDICSKAVAALRESLAMSMVADESIDNQTKWLTRDDVHNLIKAQLPVMIELMKPAPKK